MSSALFSSVLPDPAPFLALGRESPDELYDAISEALYHACESPRDAPSSQARAPGTRTAHERWLRLLDRGDHKGIWGAVNWQGGLSFDSQPAATPSEEDFVEHYSTLLNPDRLTDDSGLICPDVVTYCPVLDDPITEGEVCRSIGRLAVDKAPGPDGVPPGTLKFIPPSWVG